MALRRNSIRKTSTVAAAKQESFMPAVIDYADMPIEAKGFAIETAENVLRMLSKGEKKYYFECARVIKETMEE